MILKILDDFDIIRRTFLHEKVFKYIKDDSTPSDYIPCAPIDGYLIYLGVFHNDIYLGLFEFVRKNGATFEAHICLLPSAYGFARNAGKEAIGWLFNNQECDRIIAEVPCINVHAISFAKDIGFERYGINKNSIRKDGKLIDLHCFGISRG